MAGLSLCSWASGPTHSTTPTNKAQKAAIKRGLDANHTAFIENKGQWDRRVDFRAQAQGLDYWLTKDGVTFDYHRPAKHGGKLVKAGQVVKMSFVGSQGASSELGKAPKAHTAHYMSKGSGRMLSPRAFGEVTSRDVYSGVDFRSYYDGKNLRYDFIAKPGADAGKIKLKFDGASKVAVKGNDLEIGTQLGTFAHGKLFAYQMVNGKKSPVAARFVDSAGVVGFKLGAYDHSKTLIIDPVVYGTYYGGDDGWDAVTSVVADANGNVFMTGFTQATLFPITVGPYFTSLKGTQNAFVARLQGDAYNIDYSAYFGGSHTDYGQYIAVDQFNNVWIAGVTTSLDFPGNTKTHTSTTQPNIFVMRWQASQANVLDPLTHPAIKMLGYDGNTAAKAFVNGFAIVPDPNPAAGDPVVICMDGVTDHALPEVTTGTFAATKGYVVKYSYDGTNFNATTATQYIGDGLKVNIGGIAVDNQGAMYICGDVGDGTNNYDTSVVGATTFVTTSGVFTNGRLLQKNDLFIRKYSAAGALTYSCLIGGSSNESIGGQGFNADNAYFVAGNAIAIDSLGDAYITGNCTSFDYPRTRGAFGEVFDAWQNVVVTKISPDASQIIYSTNLKVVGLGEGNCQSSVIPAGIAIDQSGQAFITGNIFVAAMDWPGTSPENPTTYNPGSVQTGGTSGDPVISSAFTYTSHFATAEPWLNVLDPTGTKLVYGTYLGGALDDRAYGPYVDSFGDVWVFGWTDSIRSYTDPTNPLNTISDSGSLPSGLITNLAFKKNGDAGQYAPFHGVLSGVWWTLRGDPFDGPSTWSWFEAKDGWLAKFSIGRPIVSQVNLTPTTVPGGFGATSTCGLVLSSPAPVQGASITVQLLSSNMQSSGAASFSSSSQVTTTTVTIPGGATTPTSPLIIYTNAVNTPTQVLVRAYYQGNFLIAPLTVVPWLKNFTVTPSGTVGGNAVTGTIVLATTAPTGGITVTVQSSSSLLTPPSTISIAAGQQSATFSVATSGVDSKSFPILTASLLGFGIAQSVELDPAAIQSVVLTPLRVSGLTTITGTITLNGLPGPNFPTTTIFVQTNPAGYTVTPGTIAGTGWSSGGTATFTIATPYETATVTRVCEVDRPAAVGTDYTNQSSLSNFTVDPTPMLSFTLDKTSANPGDVVNGTIALSSTADSNGAIVNVTSSSPIVSFTSPVVIPSGSTGATFQINVGATVVTAPTTVTLTATRGTVTIQKTLLVNPSTLQLSLSPTSVLGGNPSTATVTISNPAPSGGLPITVTFNPTGYASVANAVTIPAGQQTATFTIATVPTTANQNVTVTAGAGTLSSSQTLTVRAPSLTAISFTPATVLGLKTTVCKLTLDGPAAAGGTTVTLSQTNGLGATLPTTVTIPAGKTSYAFSVLTRRVSRPLSSTVTASTGSVQVSAVYTVVRY